MSWEAVPDEPAQMDDYSDSLWMVPDLQRFSDAVDGIDFASGSYKIAVNDEDNDLLHFGEAEDEVDSHDETDLTAEDDEKENES
jgi:hypothetical protein